MKNEIATHAEAALNKPNVTKSLFWDYLDRRFRRTEKMINWMIDGQFQHGISPMSLPTLTPERIEELYNVDFGD